MEATGACWNPVYYLLEDSFTVQLLNARHLHNVPGRKTDVIDAEWICRMVQHGLVRPSFVPPAPIRQLRDLTRYRTEVVRERVRDIARSEKLLEDAGIKLSAVAADLLGKSARAMLEAMVAGQRDPQVLADMALRGLKSKRAQLVEALTGRFSDHHAFLVRAILDRIDAAAQAVERISVRISDQITPMRRQAELLATIPGVNTGIAEVIIAEVGTCMSVFPSAGHLASWAAVCPGNNESAGNNCPARPVTATRRCGRRWARPRWPSPAPRTPTSPPATSASPPAAARNAPSSRCSTRSSSRSGTCSPPPGFAGAGRVDQHPVVFGQFRARPVQFGSCRSGLSTPVRRLSGTSWRGTPPKNRNAATCASVNAR
jgi:transposase